MNKVDSIYMYITCHLICWFRHTLMDLFQPIFDGIKTVLSVATRTINQQMQSKYSCSNWVLTSQFKVVFVNMSKILRFRKMLTFHGYRYSITSNVSAESTWKERSKFSLPAHTLTCHITPHMYYATSLLALS